MPKYSTRSSNNLAGCHPELQKLFNEVIKWFDCSILCGYRGQEAQDRAFANGHSKLEWPNSKHNKFPSDAVDAVPYPIDWEDTERFALFAGFVMGTARQMGIQVKWGGLWKTLKDYPHFERIVP